MYSVESNNGPIVIKMETGQASVPAEAEFFTAKDMEAASVSRLAFLKELYRKQLGYDAVVPMSECVEKA